MVTDSKTEEQILQDSSQQIVDDLELLIITLAGNPHLTSNIPAKLQVSTFVHGKGLAMLEGKPVTIIAHPTQSLNSGDVVIGVPLKANNYYVVGVI